MVKKISELTAITSLADADIGVIVQSGTTYKITVDNMVEYAKGEIEAEGLASLTVNTGDLTISAGVLRFADGTTMSTAAATATGMTSTTDLNFASDSDANGSGDTIFSTSGTERLRIAATTGSFTFNSVAVSGVTTLGMSSDLTISSGNATIADAQKKITIGTTSGSTYDSSYKQILNYRVATSNYGDTELLRLNVAFAGGAYTAGDTSGIEFWHGRDGSGSNGLAGIYGGFDAAVSNNGRIELKTSSAGSLTTAITINSSQNATFAGAISVDDTTDSTSTLTGSIQTDGGLGVVKRSHFGEDVLINGILGFEDAIELTIATGVITITKSYHTVDTEADAGTDDLDTINGGTQGDILILVAATSTRDVVLKDGTGNLRLAGDFTLDHVEDRIVLNFNGANWCEISRSNNSV